MATSPATPTVASGSRYSAKVAVPLVEKTVAPKVAQSVATEPSPASTYGASAIGDSVPVTPQEFNGRSSFNSATNIWHFPSSCIFVVCYCTASLTQSSDETHLILK